MKNIIVIDLIKEYHGFIDYDDNNIPFAWRANYNTVNFGVSYEDIEKNEAILIYNMSQTLYNKPINVISLFSSNEGLLCDIQQIITIDKYTNILSTKELLQNENIQYLRLPSTDHSPPSYKAIIDFAKFTQMF